MVLPARPRTFQIEDRIVRPFLPEVIARDETVVGISDCRPVVRTVKRFREIASILNKTVAAATADVGPATLFTYHAGYAVMRVGAHVPDWTIARRASGRDAMIAKHRGQRGGQGKLLSEIRSKPLPKRNRACNGLSS